MEMHQVRYFLAVARTLHFTRAADDCHVTQPSLTRAIKQLEDELGGDLFRRERPQAQLTELGQRMLPLLKQCYESAMSARSLASAMKSGDIGGLNLALSRTIDVSLLIPRLMELQKHFSGLRFKLLRRTGLEVAESLKRGDAELGIAASIGDMWERLDSWPLFSEGFCLALNAKHPLADRTEITAEELRQQRFLVRSYCEHAGELAEFLRSRGIDMDHCHEVTSERDLSALLDANMGVVLVPASAGGTQIWKRTPVEGLELRRTVHLYGVAGRQRSAAGSAMLKMLRAAEWSEQQPNAQR
jgi:DNA-binding transcriptional LysR family regulator